MSGLSADPHGKQEVLTWASPEPSPAGAMILVHGRGGSPEDVLALAREIGSPAFSCWAPRAASQSWYPLGFMAPISRNEPWLTSALDFLGRVSASVEEAGHPPERTVLLGFSQGACLALEYAHRNPRRYGAVIGFSGGLIGPAGTVWEKRGDLAQTPVFLGCSDRDPHIPLARVLETEEELGRVGAVVDRRVYPGMGHTVNNDELSAARDLLDRLAN